MHRTPRPGLPGGDRVPEVHPTTVHPTTVHLPTVRIAALRAAAVLAAVPALLAACAGTPRTAAAPPPAAEASPVYAESRPSMSTLVTVTISGATADEAASAAAEAFAVFERVEAVMNEWREDSPLGRLNAAAGSGAWVELPADLCEVLRLAVDGARRTGGLFDPTWAALRGLWRFGDGEAPSVPDPAALAARCRLVSWRGLEVEPPAAAGGESCRARLAERGMAVGLGGIAKGWGVDRAVARLRARGLRDFAVQAGGDLFAAGRRAGRPWRVGVRDPRGPPDAAFAFLDLSDRAFSTSADSERFFLSGGGRPHHLLDPRTCRPATASRSASVLAPTAVDAEVLGKAVFVLGGEAGLRLAEREGAEAVLVTADGRVEASRTLAGRLAVERAPLP